MNANLHLHSRHSDGTSWPKDVAIEAAAAGVRVAALTDHDTFGGSSEFLAACAEAGVRAFVGCEIDCVAPDIGYKSELLAYFPHGDTHRTRHMLREISTTRYERMEESIRLASSTLGRADLDFGELCLRKIGDRSDAFDIEDFSFNKIDVFDYLREKEAIDRSLSYKDFKKAFFESGVFSDARYPKPDARRIADTVVADGGLSVVPHIGHEFDDSLAIMLRDRDRLRAMLAFFRDLGVSGVELYHYRNTDREAINDLVRSVAGPMGFFFTYGSDCHGPGSGKHTIGEFSGDFAGFPA